MQEFFTFSLYKVIKDGETFFGWHPLLSSEKGSFTLSLEELAENIHENTKRTSINSYKFDIVFGKYVTNYMGGKLYNLTQKEYNKFSEEYRKVLLKNN